MALDGVLKLSLCLSLFVRNCPLKCPRRKLQNETYCHGQAQTKTPETVVVSGVLQVSGINSALGELRCATGGLQTVLLALTWQKPLYLQRLAGLTNKFVVDFVF